MIAQSTKQLVSKSKYELNLAEWPLGILSKRPPKNLKEPAIIEYQDTITGKGGKVVPRKWRVKSSVDYGFGSNQVLKTLFELFQVWKEHDFLSPNIRFESLYNLIGRLGLENTKSAYKRIRQDLNALVEISIEAKNAFWDNETGAYVDKTFHLFNEVSFYHEDSSGQTTLPFAFIQASDVLYGSVQANALFTTHFTSEWFRTLTPTEQRLALYLSKMFRNQPLHRREVTKLAEQIPIQASSYKHIKQQLTEAVSGLLKKGYPLLESFEYERQKIGRKDNIVFHRKDKGKKLIPPEKLREERTVSDNLQQSYLVGQILEVTEDEYSRPYYMKVARELPEDTIWALLSETKQAHLEGRIHKTKARYFTDLVERELGHRPSEGNHHTT